MDSSEMVLDTVDATAPAAEAVPAEPQITPDQEVAHAAGVDAAFAQIRSQPKVRIRVPKVHGNQVVIINGARFNIVAGEQVEVPEQVAQILSDAGRI